MKINNYFLSKSWESSNIKVLHMQACNLIGVFTVRIEIIVILRLFQNATIAFTTESALTGDLLYGILTRSQ